MNITCHIYIDLYSNFLFKNIKNDKSSYGICNNTFWIRFKLVGTFTTLPCILYCMYICNWKVYANARWGVIKHTWILLFIETKFMFSLFSMIWFHKFELNGLPCFIFLSHNLQINTWSSNVVIGMVVKNQLIYDLVQYWIWYAKHNCRQK
jgi:hypothetical protein